MIGGSNCGTKIAKSSTAPSDNIADRLAPAAGVLAGAAVVAVEESAHAQTTNVANAAAAAPPNELIGEAVIARSVDDAAQQVIVKRDRIE